MSYSKGDEIDQGVVSDCCGAQVTLGDLCCDCYEHCEPFDSEEEDDV